MIIFDCAWAKEILSTWIPVIPSLCPLTSTYHHLVLVMNPMFIDELKPKELFQIQLDLLFLHPLKSKLDYIPLNFQGKNNEKLCSLWPVYYLFSIEQSPMRIDSCS